MYGYAGKTLHVNLTSEKTRTEFLKENEAKKYIGGIGYAIKLVYDNTKPNLDPLTPENVLVLSTGPMGGALVPTGSGHVFAAKSPLTGAIGVSIAQGFLARNIIRAGFDAIVFRGRAKRATVLWIDDDQVQFIDASDLWGKSPARTEETIRENLGDTSIRVAAIGPAGERLARIACIISDLTRVAGRTGMGAVMGSKNLKAIAIRGSNDIEVADPDGLLRFCREFFIKARGSSAVKFYANFGGSETFAVKDRDWATIQDPTAKYRDLGTLEDILVYHALGCLPVRNFSATNFVGIEKISGKFLNEHYVAKVDACSSCSIGCEHIGIIPDGPYKGAVARLDYGPIWAFGPNCGIDQVDSIIKAIDLCNFFGLDAISTGNIIGFAMDCYERGILAYADTDGVDLKFGNHQAMLEMVQKIGLREGLGDTLAEGVKRAAQCIGKGAEMLANHIKGLEMPGYSVGCLKTAALGFAVSFRGADQNRHWAHLFDVKEIVNRHTVEKGRGKLVKDMEDFYAIMDSMIICTFLSGVYERFQDLARLYNLVTGFGLTPEELRMAGERINNLARMFNIRESFTRIDDHLPIKTMAHSTSENDSKANIVTKEELDFLLDDYYDARGWTKEGVPTQEKLRQLNMEEDVKN